MSALIRKIIHSARAPAPIGPYRWESHRTSETPIRYFRTQMALLLVFQNQSQTCNVLLLIPVICTSSDCISYILLHAVMLLNYYIRSSWGFWFRRPGLCCTLNFVQISNEGTNHECVASQLATKVTCNTWWFKKCEHIFLYFTLFFSFFF